MKDKSCSAIPAVFFTRGAVELAWTLLPTKVQTTAWRILSLGSIRPINQSLSDCGLTG
jgi:hypothetical protein